MFFTLKVKIFFFYILGWSHKCFKSTSVGHKAADSIEFPSAVTFEQVKII